MILFIGFIFVFKISFTEISFPVITQHAFILIVMFSVQGGVWIMIQVLWQEMLLPIYTCKFLSVIQGSPHYFRFLSPRGLTTAMSSTLVDRGRALEYSASTECDSLSVQQCQPHRAHYTDALCIALASNSHSGCSF